MEPVRRGLNGRLARSGASSKLAFGAKVTRPGPLSQLPAALIDGTKVAIKDRAECRREASYNCHTASRARFVGWTVGDD